MKPLWKAGSACYDWVDENALKGDAPEITTDNDYRLVTTFFDDDLEENVSGPDVVGKDLFTAAASLQHHEPSGLGTSSRRNVMWVWEAKKAGVGLAGVGKILPMF